MEITENRQSNAFTPLLKGNMRAYRVYSSKYYTGAFDIQKYM